MVAFFALSVLIGITIIISEDLADTNTVGILLIIISCVLYMILHEGLHLLFLWKFSGRESRISFGFPAVSVSCDGHFTRKQFIAIASAPVLYLGIFLIMLLLFLPGEYTFLISILLTLIAAASGGDLLQIFHALKYPRNASFQDKGDETTVYAADVRTFCQEVSETRDNAVW